MDQHSIRQRRQDFPDEAVTWLVGSSPRTVVVLGDAELAAACAALGHDVTDAHTGTGTGPEALPFPDRSVDVVLSPRGVPRELDEVARVLRAGGQFGLVHTDRDRRIPWARKLDQALGVPDPTDAPAARVTDSALFGDVAEESFRHWQVVNNETLRGVVARDVAHLDEAERERRFAAAAALYADYGRGADGMQLPWVSRCFRATVTEVSGTAPRPARDDAAPDRSVAESNGADESGSTEAAGSSPAPVSAPQDGSDSDLLLIDFR